MGVNKNDLKDLIKKAKKSLHEGDLSYDLLESYIKEAENMLPDIKGKLNSMQREIYDKLEAAVGP